MSDPSTDFLQILDQKHMRGSGQSYLAGFCGQYCQKIRGGHGYVDRRCPKKCQNKYGYKPMPAGYDSAAKALERAKSGFHFGGGHKTNHRHHKRHHYGHRKRHYRHGHHGRRHHHRHYHH